MESPLATRSETESPVQPPPATRAIDKIFNGLLPSLFEATDSVKVSKYLWKPL